MATSLARQLKSLETPYTVKLVQKRGRYSFLYDYFEAAAIDCDTHYALAVSALESLIAVEPSIARFKTTLFDPSAKSFDRSLRSQEENDEIDIEVKRFLFQVVAPYFLLSDAHKVLEWLIYKFEVNLFNTDLLILSALPHHETRLFGRLLQAIPEFKDISNKWHFLRSAQKNGLPVLKTVLINRSVQEHWFLSLMIESLDEFLRLSRKNTNIMTLVTSIILGCLVHSQDEALLCQVTQFICNGLSSKFPCFVLSSYAVVAFLSTKMPLSPSFIETILKKACRKYHKYRFKDDVKVELGLMVGTVLENQEMEEVQIPPLAIEILIQVDLPSECWQAKAKLVHNVVHFLVKSHNQESFGQLYSFVSALPKHMIDHKVVNSITRQVDFKADTHETQSQLLRLILVLGDVSPKDRLSLTKKLSQIALDAVVAVSLIDEATLVKKDDLSSLEQRIHFDLNSNEWRHVMILLEIFASAESFESSTSLLLLCQQLLRESLLTDTSCEYFRCLIIRCMVKCVQLGAELNCLEIDSVIESFKFSKKDEGFQLALSLLTLVAESKKREIVANFNILLVNLVGQPDQIEKAILTLVPTLIQGDSKKSPSPPKSKRASKSTNQQPPAPSPESLVDAFTDAIFEIAPHKRLFLLKLLLAQLPERCSQYAISLLESETVNEKLAKFGDRGKQMVNGRKQLALALRDGLKKK